MPAKIVAIAYDDPDTADQALQRIRELEDQNQLALEDAAVVVREEDGSLRTTDVGPDTERRVQGGALGALTGTLVGMLFGPVGMVAGLIGGGAIGAHKWHDVEIKEDFLTELSESMAPNSSAIVILGEEEELSYLAGQAPPELRGRIIQTDLTDVQVEKIRAAAGR